jgi:hypothetical protein
MMILFQRRCYIVCILGCFLSLLGTKSHARDSHTGTVYSPEKASFAVKFKDEVSPYQIISAFVLPGEDLTIEVQNPLPQEKYLLSSTEGITTNIKNAAWRWRSPDQSGLYPLHVVHPARADSIILNVFVMVPYSRLQGSALDGYKIGKYPSIPLKSLPIYRPPRGFIKVTEENQNTPVSPHFRLKDFLCKQESNYPKYIVLKEKLLLKLELILEKVNEEGIPCKTFHVMSGYRTPYYNKLIGNVKYSRHLWGGAADIFIDENPRDEMMDDLNGDGRIDFHDAGVLYDIIDQMYGKPWYELFLGGLGRYKRTDAHGPFVHVDVRGFRARWGD